MIKWSWSLADCKLSALVSSSLVLIPLSLFPWQIFMPHRIELADQTLNLLKSAPLKLDVLAARAIQQQTMLVLPCQLSFQPLQKLAKCFNQSWLNSLIKLLGGEGVTFLPHACLLPACQLLAFHVQTWLVICYEIVKLVSWGRLKWLNIVIKKQLFRWI